MRPRFISAVFARLRQTQPRVSSRASHTIAVLALIAGVLAGQTVSQAQTNSQAPALGTPQGEVLLTITGQIGRTNRGDAMAFDRAMLAKLPRTSFTTGTIWTQGPHRFTGVALSDLLEAVAANGDTLRATALNDYEIAMPIANARDGALIAYAMDGRAMSVREKGPLWIVYPYDADPSYQRETIYARSIWQLTQLHVAD